MNIMDNTSNINQITNKNYINNIYVERKMIPIFHKEIQPIIFQEIQPVIKTEIQPIIYQIIQPVYQNRNKLYVTNQLGKPELEKNIITIEYPINDMNRKYLQNISLAYIEKCFEKAEEEFRKKNDVPQRQNELYKVVNESKINEVPKSPFLSPMNIKNPNL